MSRQRRYLIVFDLNGTLIDRIKPSASADKRQAIKMLTRPHDLSVLKYKVYLRPHCAGFFDRLSLLNHSLDVATWTSAYSRTTMPIIQRIFSHKHQERCRFMMFREDCDNTEHYGDKNECKDLEKIWSRYDGEFSAVNTVLVDDSVYKARKQPENHLHIPSWEVIPDDFIMSSTVVADDLIVAFEDRRLEYLAQYLEQLVSDGPGDVREYLRSKPPVFD